MENSNFTWVAFLHSVDYNALSGYGISANLIEWIYRMLKSRVISSSLGERYTRKTLHRITPQAGAISPLL